MTEYATVYEFNSQASLDNDNDVALLKKVEPPVVYYTMSVSYYKRVDRTSESPVWQHLSKKPRFELNADSLVFYFIDCQQGGTIDAVGAVLEFNQEIGPFDDEVAAVVRMAGPWPETFVAAEADPMDAFELKPERDRETGFEFETAGKYSYTVSLITFPDRRLYWHDPEMDVDT